jgi:hypothetical protein
VAPSPNLFRRQDIARTNRSRAHPLLLAAWADRAPSWFYNLGYEVPARMTIRKGNNRRADAAALRRKWGSAYSASSI